MLIDPNRKLAGLMVPVFALRHEDDLGIGDTAAVKQTIEFCARHGIGVLQVLPINETGGDNSPYNAISSVALDPVLLSFSPRTVPGFQPGDLDQAKVQGELADLRQGPVKYPRVKRLKEDLLRSAYARFSSEHLAGRTPLARAFDEFKNRHAGWLPQYTLFRTLVAEHGGNACWTQWPLELQRPAGAESWLSSSPDAERLGRYRDFCAYVQWVAFSQWQEVRALADDLAVELMGDIPFGVNRYSADVWGQPELFDLDWYGGAPAEPSFAGDPFVRQWGQNWGIPLYNWSAHADQDFSWWRQRIERVSDFFHYFRIDHVLGFFRVYAFPWPPERNHEFVDLTHEQAAAKTGGHLPLFLPAPDDTPEHSEMNASQGVALLKVIRQAAGATGIVAEDLGVVPPYVRPILQALDIPGFYIPMFERVRKDRSYKPKEKIPPLSLATYATHDHPPLGAFYEELVNRWHGPDGHEAWLELKRLMRFLGMDPEHPPKTCTAELHQALLRALLESRAWLAVFMVTDLILTSQRFNQPGLHGESCWSERLDRPLPAYQDDPQVGPRIRLFSDLIRQTGRVPARQGQSLPA